MQITIDTATASNPLLIAIAKQLLTQVGYVEHEAQTLHIEPDKAIVDTLNAGMVPHYFPTAPVASETHAVEPTPIAVWPFPLGEPPAPPAPPVSPATPPAGIDVDVKGYPWDGRIHSSSRAKVADGSWRQRRNLDPVVLAAVERELQQTMGLPVTTAAPVSPLSPPPAVVPPAPFALSAVPPVPPVSISPTPLAGAAPSAFPSETAGFPALMTKLTAAFVAKTITQEQILAAVQSVGLPSLPMLVSRPDLVVPVATALGIAL